MCKVIIEDLSFCGESSDIVLDGFCKSHYFEFNKSAAFRGIQKARREAIDLRNANELQDAYAEECKRLGITNEP